MEKVYSLGLYEKSMPSDLSIKEKLLCARNSGFDFLELSIDETDEKLARLYMKEAQRLEIKNFMHETGIFIETICLSGHRKFPLGSSQYAEKSLEIMLRCIILARDLGVRIIQLAGYDVYYEQSCDDTKALFEKNLNIACKMASKYGVILAFETMETEFMNTIEKAMTYVNKVNSPYLGIYPDIGNLTNASVLYGTNVIDDIKLGSGHIFAAHLKETTPGVFREVPFGTGHVEFEKIIDTLLSMGVRKFVAEFWYMGETSFEENIIFANNFIRNKFKV